MIAAPAMAVIPIADQVAEQQYMAKAVSILMSKVSWRLIPFLALLELSAYINRVSIVHAVSMGIKTDLGMSTSEMDWAISIFFYGYLIFDIPNIILFRFLGPTRYLSLSMISWGALLVGMAFTKSATQLIAVRLLLGMSQAGFFAGTIIYLTLWFPRREQTIRITIFWTAAVAACGLGGLLAHGITYMDGIGGMHGWQWMFLLEGLPIIPLGIATYLFLGNIPDTVQWLDNIEKQLLTNILRKDAGMTNLEITPTTRISWTQVRYAFVDWRVYFYGLIAVGLSILVKPLINYLPSIIETMDISKGEVQLLVVLPYALGCLCCLLIGSSASRYHEYGLHFVFSLSIALAGFVLMTILEGQGKVAMYLSICVACSGAFAAFPILLSWVTNNVGGHTKRAIVIAFVMSISQIGGIVSPQIYRDVDKPTYFRGHIICAAVAAATLIATLVLRICLARENHRRERLCGKKYKREVAVKEPCDWHPDFRYQL